MPQRPLPGTNGNLPRSMHCNGQVAKKRESHCTFVTMGCCASHSHKTYAPKVRHSWPCTLEEDVTLCQYLQAMRAPPGRGLRQPRPSVCSLLRHFFFFFLTGFCMFCTPTDFPIQVSPQWIKSADRTVVEVTNLVMQADTSGDGLLDTQEITVGAVPVGFVTWPRRRCAKAVPRVLSVLGQPCPSNSATVLLLGSLHVEAVLFSRV